MDFMKNRFDIAKNFAKHVHSDKIKKIILFGSVARREDTKDSDIDVLIVSSFKDEVFDLVYDKIYEILINDEELISAHFVEEEKFEKEKNFSFLSNVIKEGVVIG